MPASLLPAARGSRLLARSLFAMAVAFVANAALSLATDQLLHVLGVYPPWGEPMNAPALNALALSYRIIYGVLAGVIVAALAPHAPMRHALILGIIGCMLATLGAIVAVTRYDLGPSWYPIALALLSFPVVWLGAAWHVRRWRA